MIVATPKTQEQLNDLAKQIAEIICSIQAGQRGSFYSAIAQKLDIRAQGFQASLFRKLAEVN